MSKSTGYESGDARYGEVPFGTVAPYDPAMEKYARAYARAWMLSEGMESKERREWVSRSMERTYPLSDSSPPVRVGDMVSINARGEAVRAMPARDGGPVNVTDAAGNAPDALAAIIGVRRQPASVPFGGYRIGDRITLADGIQGTITDVGPDGVYTAQLDGVIESVGVAGTIGQTSRDSDNRRLRQFIPAVMEESHERFLKTRDALKQRLRDTQARNIARGGTNPLPLGATHGGQCAWRPERSLACESRPMRCRARKHGLLSAASRKPGRVTACRVVS